MAKVIGMNLLAFLIIGTGSLIVKHALPQIATSWPAFWGICCMGLGWWTLAKAHGVWVRMILKDHHV